ncbi:CfaE/CblD family pilus tip adhesin [Enterobacter mori]|jgi:hypothetical protein
MMNKHILLSLLACLWAVKSPAAPPADKNTTVSLSFDRTAPPNRFYVWKQESAGYDPLYPYKWGMNTLTCLSSTNPQGGCRTYPYWVTDNPSPPYAISVQFTHLVTNKKVELKVYGEKHMFLRKSAITLASYVSDGSYSPADWDREPYFDFYIVGSELSKLNLSGIWTQTLIQNVKLWNSGNCGGLPINLACDATLAKWSAEIKLEVVDTGNQQIYLPAFPHSTPVVNLNLTNFPGRPGGSEISGETRLDMCLYDGNNSTSRRLFLRFEDDGLEAVDRDAGAFSIRRRGGNQTEPRDRLDYRVSVTHPVTGATETVTNGNTVVWEGVNNPKFLRQVILPGGRETVQCVPAPIILTTPSFSASSKNAGDYTGTLRVIYTPSTL